MDEIVKTTKTQTAIVTGGTRGIGRGLVEGYLAYGWNVVFSYLSSKDLAEEIVNASRFPPRLLEA